MVRGWLVTAENPSDPRATVVELAALWRRQYECLDALVHGYLIGEQERQAGRPRTDATVTLADLSGARHGLSVPRFYSQGQLTVDEFRHSDPLDELYAGRLEAEWRRMRNEDEAVAE
jgi:hypothetical protein